MENPVLKFLHSRCFNQITRKEGTITGVPEKAISTACFVEVTYDTGEVDLAAFGWLQIIDGMKPKEVEMEIEVKPMYGPINKSLMKKIIERRFSHDSTDNA